MKKLFVVLFLLTATMAHAAKLEVITWENYVLPRIVDWIPKPPVDLSGVMLSIDADPGVSLYIVEITYRKTGEDKDSVIKETLEVSESGTAYRKLVIANHLDEFKIIRVKATPYSSVPGVLMEEK